MFFKQIQRHSDNFSYIIADESSGEAAVVDSSYNADELIKILKTEKFQLKYIINTHGHSDHTAGNIRIKLYLWSKIGFSQAIKDSIITFQSMKATSLV